MDSDAFLTFPTFSEFSYGSNRGVAVVVSPPLIRILIRFSTIVSYNN